MNIQTFAILLLSATLVACGSDSDGVSTPELTDVRETFLENDNAASAQLVAINSRIAGSLSDTDVKDGYRIDVTSAGTITITLTGDADTDFDIGIFTSAADADSAIAGSPEFFAAYSASDETSTESLTYSVVAGTYYFAVSNEDGYGTGNYTLSIYGNITSGDAPALSTYSVLIDNAAKRVSLSNGFSPSSIVACGEIDFYDTETSISSAGIYNSSTCATLTSTFTNIPTLDAQCAAGTAPYDLDVLYYTSSIPSPCDQ